jgi:hypothetical protein
MPRVVLKMSIQVPKRPPGLGAKGLYEISWFKKRFDATITGVVRSVFELDDNLILIVHSTRPGTKAAGSIPLAIVGNIVSIDSTHCFHLPSFWTAKQKSRMTWFVIRL